jgi:hypothetical protein
VIDNFTFVLDAIFGDKSKPNSFSVFDPSDQLDADLTTSSGIAQTLNAAFLIGLSGESNPEYEPALHLLQQYLAHTEWQGIASFYLDGIDLIREEVNTTYQGDNLFKSRLDRLASWIADKRNSANSDLTQEYIWSVFFPEATGIRANREKCIDELRQRRVVRITKSNPNPISNPVEQIIFTSNVLLTTPKNTETINELPYSNDLIEVITRSYLEDQSYWYDHPIQVGVAPERNEIIYGLRGLDKAIEFEKQRGYIPADSKSTCVLSVSTTHRSLQEIAKQYIDVEIQRAGGLRNLDIYVFTENDTQKIIQDILAPAAKHYLAQESPENLLAVLGVDGAYGRHYSFLKAITAYWSVLIQPNIHGTFKIDLDQVFPQNELVLETGQSALGHFKSPLWGAQGIDIFGNSVELGMIAGALVNESDIHQSLFNADVQFPERKLALDEHIFFSQLPQAISTEAEMMARYNAKNLDGHNTCIQRIHVTGGTNGILVDSLRRHRPFTPSFIGRAEDQAYLLSNYANPPPNLAYVHMDGLIMRHDKEVFVQEAIESAHIGKLIGDYIRLLYFSAYTRILSDDISKVKDKFDPFTGCFISYIPKTVTYIRFALKAASLFSSASEEESLEFIRMGTQRISQAINFITHRGNKSQLASTYDYEHEGWKLFYDTLDSLEKGIQSNDNYALSLGIKAKDIVMKCQIQW